jgi:MFS family permease
MDGVTRGQAKEAPGPLPAGLLLGALVVPGALGVSTAAVALPALSADLGLSGPQAAWVLAGYLVAQATCVSVFGRLGDVRGVARVLLAGAVLVAAGSLVAVLSGSFEVLLGARLLQGAGGSALFVAAYALIGARYEGRGRAQVVAVLTASLAVVAGSGTLIGGVLADELSWRVAIGLPALAILAAAPAARLAPPPGSHEARIDFGGAALLAVLASALVLLLQTPSLDADGRLPASLALLGAVAAAALYRRTRRRPDGFLPAAIVGSRRFVLGSLSALTIYAGYLAILFAAPVLLLEREDRTLTEVGLLIWPGALAGAVSAQLAARLTTVIDAWRVAAAGAGLEVAGLLLAGASDGRPVATSLSFALVLIGFSVGQVALVARVPLAVDAGVRGVASGVFTLAFWVGGAIGSALVAGLDDPLGPAGAVAAAALLPAAGAVLALSAARSPAEVRTAAPLAAGAAHGS